MEPSDLDDLFAAVDRIRDRISGKQYELPTEKGLYVSSKFRGEEHDATVARLNDRGWKLGDEVISQEGLRNWLQSNRITLVRLVAEEKNND